MFAKRRPDFSFVVLPLIVCLTIGCGQTASIGKLNSITRMESTNDGSKSDSPITRESSDISSGPNDPIPADKFPLPENARKPMYPSGTNTILFHNEGSINQQAVFYTEELKQLGWTRQEGSVVSDGNAFLNFTKGSLSIAVTINPLDQDMIMTAVQGNGLLVPESLEQDHDELNEGESDEDRGIVVYRLWHMRYHWLKIERSDRRPAMELEILHDSQEYDRVKRITTELRGKLKQSVVWRPDEAVYANTVQLFCQCDPWLRQANRRFLERHAKTHSPRPELATRFLRIAYGDREAFEEFFRSINTEHDRYHSSLGSGVLSSNLLIDHFMVACPSWMESQLVTDKIENLLQSSNTRIRCAAITLCGCNRLERFAEQIVELHDTTEDTAIKGRCVIALQKMRNSSVAFDFICRPTPDQIDRWLRNFLVSNDPAIREKAEELLGAQKSPRMIFRNPATGQTGVSTESRSITTDTVLCEPVNNWLTDHGFPTTNREEALVPYASYWRNAGNASPFSMIYGWDVEAALAVTSNIGRGNSIDTCARAVPKHIEFYGLREIEDQMNPDTNRSSHKVTHSLAINGRVYRFTREVRFPADFYLAKNQVVAIVNSVFERERKPQRFAIAKSRNDSPTDRLIFGTPAELRRITRDFGIQYFGKASNE